MHRLEKWKFTVKYVCRYHSLCKKNIVEKKSKYIFHKINIFNIPSKISLKNGLLPHLNIIIFHPQQTKHTRLNESFSSHTSAVPHLNDRNYENDVPRPFANGKVYQVPSLVSRSFKTHQSFIYLTSPAPH